MGLAGVGGALGVRLRTEREHVAGCGDCGPENHCHQLSEAKREHGGHAPEEEDGCDAGAGDKEDEEGAQPMAVGIASVGSDGDVCVTLVRRAKAAIMASWKSLLRLYARPSNARLGVGNGRDDGSRARCTWNDEGEEGGEHGWGKIIQARPRSLPVHQEPGRRLRSRTRSSWSTGQACGSPATAWTLRRRRADVPR